MSSTQNILNSAKKIYNTPMAPNIHHGLGIGGAAVTTAISYRFILKHTIEASSLSPVAQKRVKVILPTGMFATGVAVHLIAGKVASQVTLIAIAITSLIIGKVLARRKATAQAQLAKAAAAELAKKRARKPNEAYLEELKKAKDPSTLETTEQKKSIFEQEIAKQATASEAEKKEAEKKAKLANGREPSSPKGAPASTTESTSSTSKIVRTVSASKADTTNTNGSTDGAAKIVKATTESAATRANNIASKLVTPKSSTTSTASETPKAKEETNGKTTPPKTKETEKTSSPTAVATAAVKAVDATRYIFTINREELKEEVPEAASSATVSSATLARHPNETDPTKIVVAEAIDDNAKYLQMLMTGLENGSKEDRLICRNKTAETILNAINNSEEVAISPAKRKKAIGGWVLAGNILCRLHRKNAEELRKVIIGKQPDFFNIERLFEIIEKENGKLGTLLGVLLSLNAEDQALLQQKLYSSTNKYNDKFLTGKLVTIPFKELHEFAMPLDASEEQVGNFLIDHPNVSRLSLTEAQFDVAYKIVVEKGDKDLYSLGIDPKLTMKQEHLTLMANSSFPKGLKNAFHSVYSGRVKIKSEEKKKDGKKE